MWLLCGPTPRVLPTSPVALCARADAFDMIQAGDRLLLGLSGGKDSMSLVSVHAPSRFGRMFAPNFLGACIQRFAQQVE